MKRSAPMKRGKPLRRCRLKSGGTALKRTTPLKAKGRARFPRGVDEDFRAYVREQPCCIGSDSTEGGCYWWGALPAHRNAYLNEACHVKTRGAGGGDRGNMVSMCKGHHREQHIVGIRSFERVHAVDLKALAASYWRRYEAERGEGR